MHISGERCGLVFVIGCLLSLAGCYSVAYQPNPTTIHSGSAYAEAQTATAAGRDAQVYLLGGVPPLPRSAKLITFAVAPDMTSAVAVIVGPDGTQFSCSQPIQFWRGHGSKAEIDSHLGAVSLGAIPGNQYCMAFDSEQCRRLYAMCWADVAEAERYADAVTVLATVTPSEQQTGVLVGEMISVNNETVAGQTAASQSLSSSSSSQLADANSAVERGDIDAAASIYRQLSGQAPDNAFLHFNLALLLARQGKYSDAVEQMNSYLVLAPHGSRVQDAQSKVVEWQAEEQQ